MTFPRSITICRHFITPNSFTADVNNVFRKPKSNKTLFSCNNLKMIWYNLKQVIELEMASRNLFFCNASQLTIQCGCYRRSTTDVCSDNPLLYGSTCLTNRQIGLETRVLAAKADLFLNRSLSSSSSSFVGQRRITYCHIRLHDSYLALICRFNFEARKKDCSAVVWFGS